MAIIRKIPVAWGGFPGAPGYSVFYSPEAVDAVASIKTFFNAIKTDIVISTTLTIPFAGDSINDTDGQLAGSWTSPDGGVVTCTGSGAYAAGTGAFARWLTTGIVNGRRVKGRTFICPLTANDYEANGTIATTPLGTMSAAAAVLGTSGKLVLWSRPFAGDLRNPTPRAGSSYPVIAGTVADLVTSLRTRRS